MTILKKTLTIITLFVFLWLKDDKACKMFSDHLAVIKESVEKKKPVNASKINEAISFLEQVTLIKSTSDGNYFGRFSPNEQDFNNWNQWFKKNKSMLYWEEKERKVKVKSK
nr:hypothetical protein [uncultured Mucilaginibacter sp.]